MQQQPVTLLKSEMNRMISNLKKSIKSNLKIMGVVPIQRIAGIRKLEMAIEWIYKQWENARELGTPFTLEEFLEWRKGLQSEIFKIILTQFSQWREQDAIAIQRLQRQIIAIENQARVNPDVQENEELRQQISELQQMLEREVMNGSEIHFRMQEDQKHKEWMAEQQEFADTVEEVYTEGLHFYVGDCCICTKVKVPCYNPNICELVKLPEGSADWEPERKLTHVKEQVKNIKQEFNDKYAMCTICLKTAINRAVGAMRNNDKLGPEHWRSTNNTHDHVMIPSVLAIARKRMPAEESDVEL